MNKYLSKTIIPLWILLLSLNFCTNKPVVHPEHKDIIDAVFASGHIENYNQYSINANIDGFLTKIWVAEGDTVEENSKLFNLSNDVQQSQVVNAHTNLDFALRNASNNSAQILPLKLQIDQAQQKLEVDSLNYQRFARLANTQAVSRTDADNARIVYLASRSNVEVLKNNLQDLTNTLRLGVENAKSQLKIQQENNNYYLVRARAGGQVLTISKKIGDYAKKGDLLGQIGSGASIAKLYLAEDDIHRVKLGQLTLISLNSDKGRVLKARISKIYPSFDQADQSFLVDAQFIDSTRYIKNGTQLQANIVVNEKKNALVIPSYFLVNGNFVKVKGKINPVEVKIGIQNLEYTEILSGLNTDDILETPSAK